jgi:hypothetical protein
MMSFEVNSGRIISECLKEHGKGNLFFRADGLEFEERRELARRTYLESHPEIDPAHRQAILKAAITPGMTQNDVITAWGLFEEDTRTVFGHVTDDRRAAYAYFTGFAVGKGYALCFKDEVVMGVLETDDLVPPHEQELTMRLAEETGLFYFYEGDDGQMRGSTADQYHMDWDTQHLRLYTVEVVPPRSLRSIESHISTRGLRREYEIALLRLGYDSRTAPDELRTRVALSILPYSGERSDVIPEEESRVPGTDPPAHVPDSPIPLPASSLEPPEDPASVPLEKWFAYIAFGHQKEVAFRCINDQVELLRVEWVRERLFSIEQVPLLVNGVSLYDLIEVEWQGGDLIPRFKRVIEKRGHRTIRAIVTDPEREASIRHFAKLNTADRKQYRYEKGVLAFTIAESELDEIATEWLGYLPLSWVYTDTLSQT